MSKAPDQNPRKALGKGLSALLPSRPIAVMPKAAAAPALSTESERSETLQMIPTELIRPSEEQPRRDSFDGDKMHELARSIEANGVIQPITVYKNGETYTIVAGERRWRAARMAGLNEIPALVRNVEKHQVLELALIENIQREDLNPIEIAVAFERLASEHGLSHEEIAKRTGKERSTVTNFLRLLKLAPLVKDEIISGRLNGGHARALINITDPILQTQIARQVVEKQLSVREVERLVKQLTEPSPEKSTQTKEISKEDPNVAAALNEMAMALGTKVKLVRKSERAGRLEIEYYSEDDLERIYSVIVKQ